MPNEIDRLEVGRRTAEALEYENEAYAEEETADFIVELATVARRRAAAKLGGGEAAA